MIWCLHGESQHISNGLMETRVCTITECVRLIPVEKVVVDVTKFVVDGDVIILVDISAHLHSKRNFMNWLLFSALFIIIKASLKLELSGIISMITFTVQGTFNLCY